MSTLNSIVKMPSSGEMFEGSMLFALIIFLDICSEKVRLSSIATPISFSEFMCSRMFLFIYYTYFLFDLLPTFGTLHFVGWNFSSYISIGPFDQDISRSSCSFFESSTVLNKLPYSVEY